MTAHHSQDFFVPRPRSGVWAVEFKLHSKVAKLLADHAYPSWKCTQIPRGQLRAPGWPSFVCIGPGRTCFLELSRDAMRERGDVAAHLIMSGCGYGLAHSFDDAAEMLRDWGVVPNDWEAG